MRKRKSKRKIKIILGALLLILFSAFLINLAEQPQTTKPETEVSLPRTVEPNPHVLDLLTDYEANILKTLKKTGTPGVAIAIVHDTSIIYLKGFGVREIG